MTVVAPARRSWLAALLLFSLGLNVGLLWHWSFGGGETSARSERSGELPSALPLGTEEPERLSAPPTRPVLPAARKALERMADELRLEGESRRRFLATQEEFFRRSRKERRRYRRARSELRQELVSGEADRARAERWVSQVADAQQQLELAFIDSYFATYELLDPEQQRAFLRFMTRIRDARRPVLDKAERRRRQPPARQ